jgi:hypothetical protein
MNKRTTGVIVKRRLVTAARDKYFTHFYTVKLTGTKVNHTKNHAFFQGAHVYFLMFSGSIRFIIIIIIIMCTAHL